MTLTFGSTKRTKPIQKAVVAFSAECCGIVLYHCGDIIAEDNYAIGNDADELGLCGSAIDAPDHGIWIWEGTFTIDSEGECDGPDKGNWREPNKREWALLMKQEDPLYLSLSDLSDSPNMDKELSEKQIVAEAWQRRDDGAKECPKCSGLMKKKQCNNCGFSQ